MQRIGVLLALSAPAALSACGPALDDSEADAENEPDSDTDSDTDTDTDTDLGISDTADPNSGKLWYAGNASTVDGAFDDGHFGFQVTRYGDVVCTSWDRWALTGSAAPDCPACDWAFDLELGRYHEEGDGCSHVPIYPNAWDGFTASWGFAEQYDYDYAGSVHALDTVLFYYSTDDSAWFPFSFNGMGLDKNTGDATSMSFMKYYVGIYYAY